jgi:hypothetical protein
LDYSVIIRIDMTGCLKIQEEDLLAARFARPTQTIRQTKIIFLRPTLAGEKDVMACGQEELAQRARGQESGVGSQSGQRSEKQKKKKEFLDRINRIKSSN